MNQKTVASSGLIRDVMGAGGLLALCAGVSAEFGWPWALIIGGGLVLLLALVGALRGGAA